MRKVKLFIACSLDGYIAREDGGLDWLFTDQDYGYRRFIASVDTVLMGRKTYEKAVELGDTFKGKKAFVFTRREMESRLPNVAFVRSPVPFTKKLKRRRGRDIFLVGGGETVREFLDAGLIDEMSVFVHPIILGRGVPLFRPGKEAALEAVAAKKFGSGLILLKYRRRR